MKRPPLRWALLVPVVVALLVGIAGLGVFVERSVRADLVDAVDTELTRAAARDLGRGGPGARPGGATEGAETGTAPAVPAPAAGERTGGSAVPVEARLAADGTVERLNREEAPFSDDDLANWLGRRGMFTVEAPDGTSYRVLALPGLDGSTDVVALPLTSVDDSIASLRRNLLLGGIGLFVLQSLVVWAISNRVSKPVTRMSAVARRIAEGQLDTDIGTPGGTAETAGLAEDLKRMVTRLRSTIADREQAAVAAEASQRDMQRFLADASHELRTPLTALRGYSDLYAGGMLAEGEPLDRAMARVGSESERMHRLVVDMLQVVRESTMPEPVEIGPVVQGVSDDLQAAFPGRSIRLGQLDDAIVFGDAGRLHQAVLNLGANACAHTPSDVDIDIQVTRNGTAVIIDVIDHGPGVPAREAASIFKPFTRGDASRSRREHDGAGLGLAIVASVVDEHSGTVDVRETPGGGATFSISLPLFRPSSAEPGPHQLNTDQLGTGQLDTGQLASLEPNPNL